MLPALATHEFHSYNLDGKQGCPMSSATKKYWSDNELLAIPKNGYDHEIIHGVQFHPESCVTHAVPKHLANFLKM